MIKYISKDKNTHRQHWVSLNLVRLKMHSWYEDSEMNTLTLIHGQELKVKMSILKLSLVHLMKRSTWVNSHHSIKLKYFQQTSVMQVMSLRNASVFASVATNHNENQTTEFRETRSHPMNKLSQFNSCWSVEWKVRRKETDNSANGRWNKIQVQWWPTDRF